MARRRWGWGVAAGAAGVAAAVAVSAGAARSDTVATPQFAGTVTACAGGVGPVIAVDFGAWGGPIALGCDTSDPKHGINLITDTGFTTAGDTHDGPSFICRLGSSLFVSGTQYPTPAQNKCINTPPANAYWSYWLASPGSDTWSYSPLGVDQDVPEPGEVEAWTFGTTDVSGTTGQPTFSPDEVRAQETATTSTTATTTTSTSSTASVTATAPITTVTSSGGATTTATDPVTDTGRARPRSARAVGRAVAAAAHFLAWTQTADGLTNGTTLARSGYYESASGFADFGLTLDAGFALAAAGDQPAALHRVVAFLASRRHDGSGRSIDAWTGIGTRDADGGSIAKEALFTEVVGANPRHFAGHDLIAALDALICRRRASGACAGGAGSVRNASSTFGQALAVLAQLRAGDRAGARATVAFLEGTQHPNGAWPSLVPSTGDSDVDSTAIAAMALALVTHSPRAAREERRALAWIAGRQERDGGFPGAAGDSTNSAGLAIQALGLAGSRYARPIARARAFLLAQQSSDGGFAIASGSRRPDVRASAQALGGLVGTPFGTLRTP